MNKKEIEGFEGYYITPEGLVLHNDKPLKIQFSNANVPFVRLRKDGEYFTFTIAKLVALTYIGKPDNPSDIVSYLDGNNHNFNKDNLYWASRSEAYSKMYDKNNRYSEYRLAKLKRKICKPIMSMRNSSEGFVEVKRYESIADAARDVNVASASLIRCLKNQRYMCMGLYWKYLEKED